MNNYICIGGNKIPLSDEQVRDMRKSFDNACVEWSDDTVTLSLDEETFEFIVLEDTGDELHLLLKDTYGEDAAFGDNNDFRGSNVEKILDEFAAKIAAIVGEENLVEHTVDLTALDGLKDYGTVQKKMSLLTQVQASRYVDTLDKYKLDKYWWLVTPLSTPKHGIKYNVLCVTPDGGVIYYNGVYDNYGVRPFCILKSNIFNS